MHHYDGLNYDETKIWFSDNVFPGSIELNTMGSIFNLNFLFTTEQGFSIAFIGGDDDEMLRFFRENGSPNLILRNKMSPSSRMERAAEELANWFAESNSPMLIPMHYETWLNDDPQFVDKMMAEINSIMSERGKIGRVYPLERCKWYSLNLSLVQYGSVGTKASSKRCYAIPCDFLICSLYRRQ